MRALIAVLLVVALPAWAFDANGVGLGAHELDVKKNFPGIRCKPLEWKTDAASRRCDDGQISFGGVAARITFYLKADAVQSFTARFDQKDLERVKEVLRARWGAPLSEATEVIARKDKPDRRIFKMRWEKAADKAVLTSQLDKKRVDLEVWRGDFAEEIYRVK
ncbi:MAG TPA: hypothetical protein VMI15_06075 [Burkholderiales bacterium]|nr:hypothetical protein [Burkholderiales bacterium]